MLKDWQTGKEVDDRSKFVISSLNEYADEQRFREKFRKIIVPKVINEAKERNEMNEEQEKIGTLSKQQIKQIYQHVNFANQEVLKRVKHDGIKDTTFLTYVSSIRMYLFYKVKSRKLCSGVYDYIDVLSMNKLVYLTPPLDKEIRKVKPYKKRVQIKKVINKGSEIIEKDTLFNNLYNITDLQELLKKYPKYNENSLKTYVSFFNKLRTNPKDAIRSNSYKFVKKLFAEQLIKFMKNNYTCEPLTIQETTESDETCIEVDIPNENIDVPEKVEDEGNDVQISECVFAEYAIMNSHQEIIARNKSIDFILGALSILRLNGLNDLKTVKLECKILP